jgi:hypothetical protein
MRFSVSAYDIANGAGALVQVVQEIETGCEGGPPQVLLLAPSPVAVGRTYPRGPALPRCLRARSKSRTCSLVFLVARVLRKFTWPDVVSILGNPLTDKNTQRGDKRWNRPL